METTTSKAPKKLYYRIQEVSRITGVKPHVLRYWETEFPALKPQKGSNDQRRYRQGDIDVVLKIKKLLYEDKFTIAGARRQLRQGGKDRSPKRILRPKTTAGRNLKGIARRLGALRKELVAIQSMLMH